MKSIKNLSAILVAFVFIGLASSFSDVTTSSNFYMANHLPYMAKITVNYADGSGVTVAIPGGGAAFTLDTQGKNVVSTTIEGITVPVGQMAYWTDQMGHAAQIQGDGFTSGQPIDPHELN